MRKAVVVVMMAISKNTALGLGCGNTHVCVCVCKYEHKQYILSRHLSHVYLIICQHSILVNLWGKCKPVAHQFCSCEKAYSALKQEQCEDGK